jgi:RNA polymerase sigma-70 factor, ECF subfamily
MKEPHHLMEKLRDGDREAFRWLVDSFRAKVLNLCFQYLNDANEAEDVAQDVFVEVVDSVGSFRGEATISTWIYRIAVNKSLNRRKRMKLKQLIFSPTNNAPTDYLSAPIDTTHADPSTQPDDHVNRRDDQIALQSAINKLPANQKTAFLLSKYQDLSYKEIAGVMEISLPSVESLLFRAKGNLQKSLSRYLKENYGD